MRSTPKRTLLFQGGVARGKHRKLKATWDLCVTLGIVSFIVGFGIVSAAMKGLG